MIVKDVSEIRVLVGSCSGNSVKNYKICLKGQTISQKKSQTKKIIDNANLYGQNVQLEGSIVFFRHAGCILYF